MIGPEEQLALLKRIAALAHQVSSAQMLYESLARQLHGLLPTDYVSIALLDRDEDGVFALQMAGQDSINATSNRLPLEAVGSLGWALAHHRALLRADLPLDQRFPEDGQLVEAGIRSLLNLPLMAGEEVLGTLTIGHSEADVYSATDIQRLEPVCAQLALALENVRLRAGLGLPEPSHDQLKRRLSEAEDWAAELERLLDVVTELQRVAAPIAGQDSLDKVLTRIMETITEFMQVDHHISALLMAREGQARMVLRVVQPSTPRLIAEAKQKLLEGFESLTGQHLPEQSIELTTEMLAEPLAGDDQSLQSFIITPLIIARRVIGMFSVNSPNPGSIATGEISLSAAVSSQVAITVENVRLFTALQEACEELKHLDRLKDELVSTVSHEVRAPLHSISGFVELLLSGKIKDKAAQQECLETIDRQTQQLARLIDSLLDVARMEAGRFALRKGRVQMHEVIQEVVAELQPMADETRITLVNRATPDLPIIFADSERLGQVVRNLIHNALKFTPHNGHVTISTLVSADQLVVTVEDDGIGIPAEAIPHLFERFYRVESSDTRRARGTGLGLYICKQIVLAHGGDIWVASKQEKGATFCFSLPLSDACQPPNDKSPSTASQ